MRSLRRGRLERYNQHLTCDIRLRHLSRANENIMPGFVADLFPVAVISCVFSRQFQGISYFRFSGCGYERHRYDQVLTIWGLVCQKQVSRAGTSNYIQLYLWVVITCPRPRSLRLAHKSTNEKSYHIAHQQPPPQPDPNPSPNTNYSCDAIWHQKSGSTLDRAAPSHYLNQCPLEIMGIHPSAFSFARCAGKNFHLM